MVISKSPENDDSDFKLTGLLGVTPITAFTSPLAHAGSATTVETRAAVTLAVAVIAQSATIPSACFLRNGDKLYTLTFVFKLQTKRNISEKEFVFLTIFHLAFHCAI